LENLNEILGYKRASKIIKENLKISAEENLGYSELSIINHSLTKSAQNCYKMEEAKLKFLQNSMQKGKGDNVKM
jgi:hypothetical protein